MASSILYPRKTPGGGEERERGWRLVREVEEEPRGGGGGEGGGGAIQPKGMK